MAQIILSTMPEPKLCVFSVTVGAASLSLSDDWRTSTLPGCKRLRARCIGAYGLTLPQHGDAPNPGGTTRLSDIGEALGITAVAVGKMLERLGYRLDRRVTDKAVAAGCGIRRWDGYAFHDDWHLDRVVSAINAAAEVTGEPAVADA